MANRPAPLSYAPIALAASNRQAAYALSAGFLGWTLDAFDFFLVVVSQVQIAHEFHVARADVAFSLFLTLAFRPVGALIFGLLADRYGRRMPMMVDLVFYSTVEVLTGLTHNFRTFCILRALFGIGMGGEWGVGASLVMEKVSPRFRGLLSGLLQEGYAFGYLLAAIAGHFMLGRAGVGWRPMFFLGGAPAVLALFIRFGVTESEVWQKSKAESLSQLGKVLARHWPLWLYLTVLMAMLNCSSHGTQDNFPAFMQTFRKLDVRQFTDVVIIMNIGAIIGGVTFGLASDRLGRRSMMIAAFIGALAVTPIWAFSSTLGRIGAGAFAIQFFVQGAWGIIPAHINELSPDSVRGFLPGFAYQCGNLMASSIQYMQAVLVEKGHAYPHVMAISAAIIFCAAIIVTAAWHERRGIHFGAPERIGASA
jgi:MFS transporter, SHS family, lactate transporter